MQMQPEFAALLKNLGQRLGGALVGTEVLELVQEKIKGAACVIRAMPITESGASRSPIPAHGDHPIRAMPITDRWHRARQV